MQENMIRVGGVPEHFNFPFRKGLSTDLFISNGLKLAWNEYPGGTGAMLEALENDELDAATLLTEGAFKAISKGKKLKIAQFYVSSPLIWGVHTAANNQLSFDEQAQIEYLISRPLSGSHLMAEIYHKQKFTLEKSKAFTTIENLAGALQYFKSCPDTYFLWEKFTTHSYTQKGYLKRVDEIATPWPSFVLVFSKKALKEKESACQSLMRLLPQLCQKLSEETTTLQEIERMYELEADVAAQWYADLRWKTTHTPDTDKLNEAFTSLKQHQVLAEDAILSDFLVQ